MYIRLKVALLDFFDIINVSLILKMITTNVES